MRIYSSEELLKEGSKEGKLRDNKVISAKKAVKRAWGIKDGRDFVKPFHFNLEEGYDIELNILENNRGMVIIWNGAVIGIDYKGELVYKSKGNVI